MKAYNMLMKNCALICKLGHLWKGFFEKSMCGIPGITRLACFEKYCHAPPQGGGTSNAYRKGGGKFELTLKFAIFKGF